MGIDISRASGPVVAGVLIASVGLAAPFVLNAASYIVILAALSLWRPAAIPARESHSSLLSEMGTGLRHVRHNLAMLATAIRACAAGLCARAGLPYV